MENRIQSWLARIAWGVGLLVAAIVAVIVFVNAFNTPVHPDPQQVPSVTHATPLPKWTDAVEQGRQIARAGLLDQNLPGLSVAVGSGGDIVWAEGFGWADIPKRVPVGPGMRFRIGHTSKTLTSAAVARTPTTASAGCSRPFRSRANPRGWRAMPAEPRWVAPRRS